MHRLAENVGRKMNFELVVWKEIGEFVGHMMGSNPRKMFFESFIF